MAPLRHAGLSRSGRQSIVKASLLDRLAAVHRSRKWLADEEFLENPRLRCDFFPGFSRF